MSILSNILSKAAATVVDSVGNAFDKNFTSKEEKDKIKLELEKEINRHFEAIESNATKVLELELQDIASARDANVRIQESDKATWWAKNTGYFLDVFIGLIWGSITLYLIARAVNIVSKDSVDLTAVLSMYTTVTAVFMICVQFHRGSSKSSQDKEKQINKMINK